MCSHHNSSFRDPLSPQDHAGDAGSRWYAIHTRRQMESIVEQQLLLQDLAVYYPQREKTVRHARRIYTRVGPYFDSYLFVQLDIQHYRWRSVNSTFGVVSLVASNGTPLPAPVGVVEALISATDSRGVLQPRSLLAPGRKALITAGAFMNQIGVIDRADEAGAVRILLEIMHRRVPVYVDRQIVCAV